MSIEHLSQWHLVVAVLRGALFQLAEPLFGNRDRLRRLGPEDDATVPLAEFVRHAVEAMLSRAANVRLVQSHGLFVLTYRVEEGKQRVDGASDWLRLFGVVVPELGTSRPTRIGA